MSSDTSPARNFVDLPDWATDGVYVDVNVHLSFRDRLRVLIRGKLTTKSVTFTEHKPGRVESLSRVVVPPIREPKHIGYYSEEAMRDD